MKTEIGQIKTVEKWIHSFDPENKSGKELSAWYEIFDGEKWVGKAWSYKTAKRVSDEMKDGCWFDESTSPDAYYPNGEII